MGITNNMPYGKDRISKSCLGCKYFSGAISSCGKPHLDPDKQAEFVEIKDAAQTTCNSYRFDLHKAPKI